MKDEIVKGKVILAKGKDKEAISFLYENFYDDVYYTCFKFLKDDNLAKDMTHETFIKAFDKLNDLNDESKFKSWICQIANRMCLNYIKRSQIIEFENIEENETVNIPYENGKTPEEISVDNEVAEILLKAIEKLPQDQKICVFMYYYENLSVKEIAQQIGCSENTVRGKLRYANNNLQKYIENLGDEGIRLRCIGILPFIYVLFDIERAYICKNIHAQGIANGLEMAGTTAVTGKAEDVGTTAAMGTAEDTGTTPDATDTEKGLADSAAHAAGNAAKAGLTVGAKVGIAAGIVVTAAAVITAVIIGLNGKESDVAKKTSNQSTTNQEIIDKENNDKKENSDKKDNNDSEDVNSGNIAVDELSHFQIDKARNPILFGKYLYYYDLSEKVYVIKDTENGEVLREMAADGSRYRDCGDAVIILWQKGEYTDICIVEKQGKYVFEDTMYIGDSSWDYAYMIREYTIDDLMLSEEGHFVYLSYDKDKYALKSFNLAEGTINYEIAMEQGVIDSKNEYYIIYSDKVNNQIAVINIANGETIATYSKDETYLQNVRLLGEYYAVCKIQDSYLTNYRRFDINGVEDVNMNFNVEEKVSLEENMIGIELAHGLDYLPLQKETNSVKQRGLFRSDMTPIIDFSENYADYEAYGRSNFAGKYSNAYAWYDISYVGSIFLDNGKTIIEANQMVDLDAKNDLLIALNYEDTKQVVNAENGSSFEIASTADIEKVGTYFGNNYSFVVMDEDKNDIYDKNGKYIFTTSVPVYKTLSSKHSFWHVENSNYYVYNNIKDSQNKIYMYSILEGQEQEISTNEPVVYSFMANEKNLIYSTESDNNTYKYIMKNIENGEEKELFTSEYGVLYGISEYGFIIGEESSDWDGYSVNDISCEVVSYSR